MTHTDYLWFNTAKRQEFVRITDEVAAVVGKSGVTEGMVLVSAMHITAGVYVNDWEDGLIDDFQVWLEQLAPAGLDYRHHQTGEDNADAHLKRTMMGHQVIAADHRRHARPRALGAGVLRRVRRSAEEAGRRQGDGRVSDRRQYPDRPFVGVGAVIVDGGRVLLVKRKYEPLAGRWSLPGGAVEVGETLEESIAREMLEETGLEVEVGPVIEVFDRITRDDDGRVRYHFVLVDYLCWPAGGRLQAGSDVAEAVFVEPEDLGPYGLTDKATAVIERALGRMRRRSALERPERSNVPNDPNVMRSE